MRINKKGINDILKLLEIEYKGNKITEENLKSIAQKYIPCISSIKNNETSMKIKTDLIYDIPKNYFSEINKMGISIDKIKTTYLEFIINYKSYKDKVLIYCDLAHILEDKEAKLLISKKDILKST